MYYLMQKKSLLSRFVAYYKPYRRMFAMDIFMSTVITICGLIYPLITRRIINTYVPQGMFREMLAAERKEA